jgi:LacI family transcriptional regulator
LAKKPSITDVAKLAGVSRTTVSYVLNNVPSVQFADATRQRVLDAARQLNYHPNASARSLARKQTRTLGLVVGLIPNRLASDSFLLSIIKGVSSTITSAGYRLLVEPVEDIATPDAYMSLVREARIDGMILGGAYTNDPQLSELHDSDFPIVLWGKLPGTDFAYADIDNAGAARQAVEHLTGAGHRRIACITNAPLRAPESADRLNGYRQALAGQGIPYDESLVRYGDYQERSGFEAMSSLLSLVEHPTAVFVASDVVALGALRAIATSGLRVPNDVAVVGFDDLPIAEYGIPPLTTVRVPAHDIGATAARMALNIIQTGARPASVLLETKLIVRESCGVITANGSRTLLRM